MPRIRKKDSPESPEREGRRKGINTGLHHSFRDGKIVLGPDWINAYGTSAIMIVPTVVYFVWLAKPVGDVYTWALPTIVGLLFLYSQIALFVTATMNPGFVPRDEPRPDPSQAECDKHNVIVNGIVVPAKWCNTCHHFRAPRTAHCGTCDNCVQELDHHCPWVGACIGGRNYRFFLHFTFSTAALAVLVFACCWLRLIGLVKNDHKSWNQAAKTSPASIALMIWTFLGFSFAGGLSGLHIHLVSSALTSFEWFRNRYQEEKNPHDRGLIRNWWTTCFGPIAPRLRETLPDRIIEDPYLDSVLNGNGHHRSYGQANGRHSHYLEGGVELSDMEEGRASPAPQTSGLQSVTSTLGGSLSEDERSAVSQRRIPMVGNLGMYNRDVLDTSESELSTEEAIRSHHSVVTLEV